MVQLLSGKILITLLNQQYQRYTSLALINLTTVSSTNVCEKQKLNILTCPTTEQFSSDEVLLIFFFF